MTQSDLQAIYKQGFIDGLTAFAHWRDGEQYVGTCGRNLKNAIEECETLSTYKKLQEMPPEEVPTNIRNPKGEFERINVVYAFICGDDESETVIAVPTPQGSMPMVVIDVSRDESYMPMAQHAADRYPKPVTLAIFSDRRNVTVVVPNKTT